MDISAYIGELLYEHDCVIIPGFGGFVCNYKPAEIHPVLHTIDPPSKAISFNKNLRTNDGLLVNHISTSEQTSFDSAFVSVYAWVGSATNLLKQGEEVNLNGIGKLHNDIEGNLQFIPDESVNYLKSSFGLRTITAEPIPRVKTIAFTKEVKQETKQIYSGRSIWRTAAAILLIAALVSVIQLMRLGIEIKPLILDEASVFSFVSNLFKTHEPELKPIIAEIKTVPVVTAPVETEITSLMTAQNVTAQISNSSSHTYYVIIGAFLEERNIKAARQRLHEKYSDSDILVEKGRRLTRIGYSAGSNFYKATERLKTAQQEDDTYWLMKK